MAKRKIPYKRKKQGIHNQIVGYAAGDDIIRPNSLPQLQFIQSTAFECFYAGSNAAGKTFALLLAAAKNHENPHYNAVIFRNTMGEVTRVLIEESKKLYPHLGATYNHRMNCWIFPSGAKVYFSYMEKNDDIQRHLGAEYQFIGFDELVTFDEEHFTGLMKRLRSSKTDIPRVIRATSNPYADWVFYRYFHWLNHPHKECVEMQETTGKPSCPYSGKIYEINGINTQVIMGTVHDNIHLMQATPEYIGTLKSGSPIEVAYYYYNDWTIRPAAGLYFKRGWFEFTDVPPADCKIIRAWDLAATLGKGDYTAGVLLGYKNGMYWVIDVVKDRLDPHGVQKLIKSTAELDREKYGHSYKISLPKEVAAAGKEVQQNYAKLLQGFNLEFRSERLPNSADGKVTNTTAKENKAMALSAQCQAGNVKIIRAAWNYDFILELEEFPKGRHDDQVDAFAGAFNASIGQVYIGYKAYGNIRPRVI